MIVRFLSWLLWLANARMSSGFRSREAYAMKDAILKRFGTPDGEDVQHLADICWGYSDEAGCQGKTCGKCGGTGIWSERFVLLQRWRLGARVFHSNPRVVLRWPKQPMIEGRIEHRDVDYRTSKEAQMWLALLFDRQLWWNMIAHSGRSTDWQWLPMHALQIVVSTIIGLIRRCTPVECANSSCGRRWLRLFDEKNTLWTICPHCRTRPAYDADDLPF